MEYLDKIVEYAKEINEMIPRNFTGSLVVKTANSIPVADPLSLEDGFGFEEYVFFGLAIALFLAIFIMKYDSYRFVRMASREMRRELSRDVRVLLEEKFNEDFFEQFASRIICQQSIIRNSSTQVKPSETAQITLDISETPSVEERYSTPPITPKTPRQSRIPLPTSTTPKPRSSSSPNKKSDRGDPGISFRNSGWDRDRRQYR